MVPVADWWPDLHAVLGRRAFKAVLVAISEVPRRAQESANNNNECECGEEDEENDDDEEDERREL